MSKNFVKRFFAEAEEGMEAMQVVVIAAIAAVVLGSAFAIYSGVIHPNAERLTKEATSGNISGVTQQGAGTAQNNSSKSKDGLSVDADVTVGYHK